ncbi:MAG: hypothetical protein N2380_02965 [bacterium]|nr:hypothetical protein [bacterium]
MKLEDILLSILSIPDINSCLENAYRRSIPIYVVGGTLRDILLGFKVKDLDLAVEASVDRFLKYIESLNKKGRLLKRFYTFKFTLGHNEIEHIDIAITRKEIYPKPGALPLVEPGTIREDLYRRDFTINALAVPVYPDNKIGNILDPLGGIRDLEDKRIRVLHDKSFIDDPTRIFRAIRFSIRLGFTIEPQTYSLMKSAIENGALRTVGIARIRKEIELCKKEEKSQEIFYALKALSIPIEEFTEPGN